eukprot:5211844-Karenia_brevis.AAC.1
MMRNISFPLQRVRYPDKPVMFHVSPDFFSWQNYEDPKDPKLWDCAPNIEVSLMDYIDNLAEHSRICGFSNPFNDKDINTVITEQLVHNQVYNMVGPT